MHTTIGKNAFIRALAALWFGMAALAAPAALAFAAVSVSVNSLTPSTSVPAGTTVSFTVAATGFSSPTYAVTDSFSGTSVNNGNINSSNGYFSWTPTASDIGSHTVSILVSDASGNSATLVQGLTVRPAPSLVIQSVSPSTSVTANMTLTFTAVATGFSNPTYTVTDNFSGTTILGSSINSSGYFSWIPNASQAGTHTVTVTATDTLGAVATASTTITVGSVPTVTIQSLSPGSSVGQSQNLSFYASASGFNSPTYTVSDSFSGSSLPSSAINSSGYFSWTPGTNDTGTHTITVYVVDSSGHSASTSQTITVGGGVSIQSLNPGSTVAPGTQVTFSVIASGFSSPVYTVQDSFSGTTISSSAINTGGYFTWTPTSNDVGTHNLTIYVNDSYGHTGNTTTSFSVQPPSVLITTLTPGTAVAAGTQATFRATGVGFTNPTYTVSDSFSGTTISTSANLSGGYFFWTPTQSQIGTHSITITATDSYGHSATGSITLTVQPSVVTTAPTASAVTGAVSPYTFTMHLVKGSTESDVAHLQALLAKEGLFTGQTNGYYGLETESAVKKFQARYGLEQLGEVGPGTRAALNKLSQGVALAAVVTAQYRFVSFLSVGSKGAEVKALQQRLTNLGIYSGPISGTFGPATERAVKAFQKQFGVKQAGYVGPSTRDLLNR